MWISIHALRKESDVAYPKVRTIIFDISIHALRKESDGGARLVVPPERISIHALRKESDGVVLGAVPGQSDFNPRSP